MQMDNQITMTFTGPMLNKAAKIVRVRFERKEENGLSYAEGLLPECKMESSFGFSPEEIVLLEEYLLSQRDFIWEEAGKIKKDIFTLLGD